MIFFDNFYLLKISYAYHRKECLRFLKILENLQMFSCRISCGSAACLNVSLTTEVLQLSKDQGWFASSNWFLKFEPLFLLALQQVLPLHDYSSPNALAEQFKTLVIKAIN